jgi:hypothetical protein
MRRRYSTKAFIRQMPNALLARYFKARALFDELDFSDIKEKKPDALYALLDKSVSVGAADAPTGRRAPRPSPVCRESVAGLPTGIAGRLAV